MNNDKRQLLFLIVLNALLGFALVIGIQNTIKVVDFISNLTFSSIVELKDIIWERINLFLSNDIKLVAGAFATVGIIIYDFVIIYKWVSSFKFISSKSCTSCSKTIIREQRKTGDRVLSIIYPVLRFRCVGCGQEYLKRDKGHNHHHHHETVINGKVKTQKITL